MKFRKKFLVFVPFLFGLLLFFFIPNNAALQEVSFDSQTFTELVQSKIELDNPRITQFFEANFGKPASAIVVTQQIYDSYLGSPIIIDSKVVQNRTSHIGWDQVKEWLHSYDSGTIMRNVKTSVIVRYISQADGEIRAKNDEDLELQFTMSFDLLRKEDGTKTDPQATGTIRHRRTCW